MDPNKHFPSETTGLIFSFLNHSSIAHSEVVTSSWRKAIVSNSSLYQRLDLLSCFHPFDGCQAEGEGTAELVRILSTFSQRSNQGLVDVSLDLTSIWCGGKGFEHWQDWSETERKDSEKQIPLVRIFKLLRASSPTLQRLKLVVSSHSRENPECCDTDLSLARRFIEYLRLSFPNLRDLELSLPCEVEIKSEFPSSRKRLSLLNTRGTQTFEDDCTYHLVRDLIKEVRRFNDGQLTHFFYDCEYGFNSSETSKIIKQVLKSSQTLRSLDFGALGNAGSGTKEAYQTFLASPVLSNFKFTVGKNSMGFGSDNRNFHFIIPESHQVVTPMKVIDLYFESGLGIVWDEKLKEKFGSRLEEFSLQYDYKTTEADEKFIPFKRLTSLLELNSSTLTTLKLGGQSFEIPSQLKSEALYTIYFPNLKHLSLKCFMKVTKPLLLKLKFHHLTHFTIESPNYLGSLEKKADYLDFEGLVWPIILSSGESLQHLSLESMRVTTKDQMIREEGLVFPKLKTLSLQWRSGSLSKFFSIFNYPELVELRCDHFFYGQYLERGPKIVQREFFQPSEMAESEEELTSAMALLDDVEDGDDFDANLLDDSNAADE